MQKPTIILLIIAVVAVIAGALYLPQLIGEPQAPPVMHWDASDEVDGSQDDPDLATAEAGIERTAAEVTSAAPPRGDQPRIQAILRGRVVNKSMQPVANAKVWLEIGENTGRGRGGRGGRGNRPRRIPEPVITNEQGLFAFQGEAFRNLRVSLQVKHDNYAVGLKTEEVGDILATAESVETAEVNLKDVVLKSGGQVRGRVTDLDGNPVANAEITMEPSGRNPLRWQRNRDELLPPLRTDGNGYYLFPNVPAESNPDFTVSALAKMHTPGRSRSFQVADEQLFEVPDIQLGPGFEATGFVRDEFGRPIANANVTLRSNPNRNRDNAQAGNQSAGNQSTEERVRQLRANFGRGRSHNTKTDETGRFFLEHLPSAPATLTAKAKGYLNYEQEDIDVTLGQLIQVAMADGLRITGVVMTPDGDPITNYAMEAMRLRGLPDPNETPLDLNDVMKKFREGNLDQATQDRLMKEMRSRRDQFAGGRGGRGGDTGGRGGRGGDRGGRGGQDNAKTEEHPGGKFVADGLQEGIYKVRIEAPEFARYESAEIIVRHGIAAPDLTVMVDPGVYVAGVVIDNYGDPVVGAEVELRTASLEDASTNNNATNNQEGGRRGGRGGMDMNRMAQMFMRGMNGSALSLKAKTDDDGLFVIKHVQRGVFRLTASADGFTQERGEPFQLDNNRSNFEMVLKPLGSIVGTVTGLMPEDVGEVSVGAMVIAEDGATSGLASMFGRGRGGRGGGSSFKTGKVEADGSYRLEGLNSGNYVVRTWIGSTRQMMQELGPALMTGDLQPDVTVRGGEETQWNMTLVRPQLGIVSGNVLHNGNNASGFRVELKKQDDGSTQPQPDGGRGGRGGRGFNWFGRTLSATVSASGEFTIKDVPAGFYDLSISSGRRGSTLLTEAVQVFADSTMNRTFSVQTASLKGTITTADATDIKTIGGSVSLVPNQTVAPTEDLRTWLRENDAVQGRLRDGAFEFATVLPGSYLLVMQPRNRAPTTQQVAVSGEETVVVAVGAVVANPQPNGNGNGGGPGNAGGNRGGGRGNRGGGGGNRGGGGGNRGGGGGGGRRGG